MTLSALVKYDCVKNRVLLIVGSMYMSPSTDMWISLGLCIVGSCLLQTLGEENLLALQVVTIV